MNEDTPVPQGHPDHPIERNPPRRSLDETSGFESVPSIEQTGVFDSKTSTPISSSRKLTNARSIAGFELTEMLGQGGMGRVFRADDSSGRPLAIKLLSPSLSSSPEALARFKQEGLIASQINHPNIVFVHRVDEENGTPFIAMELMTGRTLKDLVVDGGPIPELEAIRLIAQCIEGLIEAHSLGMIHRDIKPANCYLDEEGNVKVGDFGLARSLVSDSELTQTGAFLGTPLFASPEQLLGQDVDVRSDIYSLSATLYYLLAGKAPFESPHAAQVIAKIASSNPPSFESTGVRVSKALDQIVMKGLARDKEQRYQSFEEMRRDLQTLLAPKPEASSLTRRLMAGIADMFVGSIVFSIIFVAALDITMVQSMRILTDLLSSTIMLLLLFLSESIFGSSLGKAALRVRIVDIHTGAKPSISTCFKRSFVHFLVMFLPSLVMHLMTRGFATWVDALGQWLSWLISIGLMLMTWRHTKKRQLLHDFLSGTECQIAPAPPVPSREISMPAWKPKLLLDAGKSPEVLGRFQITKELALPPYANELRWFAAVDPQLERNVWLIMSVDTGVSFESIQSRIPKTMRLRFIEEGQSDLGRWFAYVAPEGLPLSDCLHQGVQLTWLHSANVVKQIATYVKDATSTNPQARFPDADHVWVDRLGRLNVVDFDIAQAGSEKRDDRRSNVMGLLNLACALALSPSHKLRRFAKESKSSPTTKEPILLPLRALRLCESVASGDFRPNIVQLLREVDATTSGPQVVSSKARVLNAAIVIALFLPVIGFFLAVLAVPSVIFTSEMNDNLRRIQTLHDLTELPNLDAENWKGASETQRQFLTSDVGKKQIKERLEWHRDHLRSVRKGLGKLENVILEATMDKNSDPLTPTPFVFKGGEDSDNSKNAEGQPKRRSSIKFGTTSYNMSDSDAEWNEDHMVATLALVENPSTSQTFSSVRSFKAFSFIWGTAAFFAVWTALTFGGVTQHLTGICFVTKDGRRMSIFRSAFRAILLFLPITILASAIDYWPLVTDWDVWWTTQLKRLFYTMPLLYLTSCILSPMRTPLDYLAGTAAVPR